MSLSVLERIAQELERRLRLLIGGANGVNVSEVIRPKRIDTVNVKDMQVILSQGTAEPIDELSYPGNPPAVAYRQTFNIRCIVMPSERNSQAVDTIVNAFRDSVIGIVCTPQASWFQFGGLAIDASFSTEEPFVTDGGAEGINIPLAVVYRHSEGDPQEMRA